MVRLDFLLNEVQKLILVLDCDVNVQGELHSLVFFMLVEGGV